MSVKLLKIDDLTIGDHHYLTVDDDCYFLGEYTAYKGYGYSATNQLISNLKKTLDKKGNPAEWQYKGKAIKDVADQFRMILGPTAYEGATYVPIPPSKMKSDPLYDDRLMQILQKMGENYNPDIRELVIQTKSTAAFHTSDQRPDQDDLSEIYQIDENLANPLPNMIVLFDDVLTTGCHFKACKNLLSARFSGVRVIGLFIARRKPANPFDDFVDISDTVP